MSTKIEFKLLLMSMIHYRSHHINKNCLNNNLIDIDFIYHKASFNSTKIFNAKISKSTLNEKHSIVEVKLNRAYLLLVFTVIFVLISIPVYQKVIPLSTGFVALIGIESLVYFLLRYYYFEHNIGKLIDELKISVKKRITT